MAEGGKGEGVGGAMLVDVVVHVCDSIVVVFLKEDESLQNMYGIIFYSSERYYSVLTYTM